MKFVPRSWPAYNMPMVRFDYVLVGGGLQSGLLVMALRAHQPDAKIALLERADRLAGNHTWCFHDGDVAPDARAWVDPLVTYHWAGYRILFPGADHIIGEAYSGVSSARLNSVVSAAVVSHEGSSLFLNAEATDLDAHRVRLRTGEEVEGTVVVDARGRTPLEPAAPAGYQKFVGMELEFDQPHELELPVVMDARVQQSDGYRFMYLLPMSDRTVLVEDTYFSDSPHLDTEHLKAEIEAYVEAHDWSVSDVVRTESGVLPMPWSGRVPAPGHGPLVAGYRGGWFHPGTGYSFPVAVRLADFVASRPAESLFGPDFDRFARDHRRQAWFPRFLNRMLFRWYPPQARRAIFERVYRLPRETVRNFYALRLSWRDRVRFLLGPPPRGLSIRHRLRPSTDS